MFNNIVFIGGIHGVGKSTICQQICNEIKLEYLSASKVLKWGDINEYPQNKKVNDIASTQDRLITGLKSIVRRDKLYLLDGHYCLINNKTEIINIPLDTFRHIRPISLNLILGDIFEIKDRLEKRDGRSYEHNFLQFMQDSELNYAKQLSKILNVPISTGTQNDFSEIVLSLRKKFTSL